MFRGVDTPSYLGGNAGGNSWVFGMPESWPRQHEASDSIGLARINLTKLDCFFDRNRKLTDEGNAGAVIYLHLSSAFDTVPHEIFLEKLI